MVVNLLKCPLTIFLLFAFGIISRAQQAHFIYLQTENAQPFYVKLNNKIASSSLQGYLILPKLTDGNYSLDIGFPKKEFPEENFQVVINKKNEGFLLKNFAEKGWGLFNVETFGITMGTGAVTDTTSKNVNNDAFSTMLANVVKDSSILQKSEPAKEIVVDKINMDTTFSVKNAALALSPATLFLKKKNKDGLEIIYLDNDQDIKDTIRVFIPFEKTVIKNEDSSTVVVQNEKPSGNAVTDTLAQNNPEKIIEAKVDTTTINSPLPDKANTITQNNDSLHMAKSQEAMPAQAANDTIVKVQENSNDNSIEDLPKVVKSSSINSDCKSFADDEDFLKLRKKMAAENSNDDMLKIAKKAFHSKCYSTEQIKNLSFLFLTNEGKYMFFDVAYAFVSDSDQYYLLQSQLTDSYYINRFKAMIQK